MAAGRKDWKSEGFSSQAAFDNYSQLSVMVDDLNSNAPEFKVNLTALTEEKLTLESMSNITTFLKKAPCSREMLESLDRDYTLFDNYRYESEKAHKTYELAIRILWALGSKELQRGNIEHAYSLLLFAKRYCDPNTTRLLYGIRFSLADAAAAHPKGSLTIAYIEFQPRKGEEDFLTHLPPHFVNRVKNHPNEANDYGYRCYLLETVKTGILNAILTIEDRQKQQEALWHALDCNTFVGRLLADPRNLGGSWKSSHFGSTFNRTFRDKVASHLTEWVIQDKAKIPATVVDNLLKDPTTDRITNQSMRKELKKHWPTLYDALRKEKAKREAAAAESKSLVTADDFFNAGFAAYKRKDPTAMEKLSKAAELLGAGDHNEFRKNITSAQQAQPFSVPKADIAYWYAISREQKDASANDFNAIAKREIKEKIMIYLEKPGFFTHQESPRILHMLLSRFMKLNSRDTGFYVIVRNTLINNKILTHNTQWKSVHELLASQLESKSTAAATPPASTSSSSSSTATATTTTLTPAATPPVSAMTTTIPISTTTTDSKEAVVPSSTLSTNTIVVQALIPASSTASTSSSSTVAATTTTSAAQPNTLIRDDSVDFDPFLEANKTRPSRRAPSLFNSVLNNITQRKGHRIQK